MEKKHRERRRERDTSMLHFPAMFVEAWARTIDHAKRQKQLSDKHASETIYLKNKCSLVGCSGRIISSGSSSSRRRRRSSSDHTGCDHSKSH